MQRVFGAAESEQSPVFISLPDVDSFLQGLRQLHPHSLGEENGQSSGSQSHDPQDHHRCPGPKRRQQLAQEGYDASDTGHQATEKWEKQRSYIKSFRIFIRRQAKQNLFSLA